MVPVSGTMSEDQIRMSRELKSLFPSYLNSLGLTDAEGKSLTLGEEGEGSFKEFVKKYFDAEHARSDFFCHHRECSGTCCSSGRVGKQGSSMYAETAGQVYKNRQKRHS